MSTIRKFFTFFCLTVFPCLTAIAADYTILGTVIDENAEPEAYATIRIYAATDTVHAASLGVTDENGIFSQTIKSPGQYIVNIASVGKSPLRLMANVGADISEVNIGTIQMGVNPEILEEVEVVAVKPLVSKEIDRIGYDVQADEDSKTATVQDILRKVPMVTVEADGTIKVRGSSDFKIYRNGRPSNTFTNNAKDILSAIPASMIKKIEVITDHGAAEDAEGVGAILNIVTMENTSVNGVMGNVRAGMMTQNGVPAGGVWLTSNIGKVTFSVNGGYFHQSEKLGRSHTVSDLVYTNSNNRQLTVSDNSGSANIAFFGLDGSYELDSLNLFTVEFGGYTYGAKSRGNSLVERYSPENQLLYAYSNPSNSPKNNYLDFNGNFNYQRLTRLKDETITLSYAISNSNNSSIINNEFDAILNYPADYTAKMTDSKQHFIEHTIQADWTRPIDSHNKFSLGAKAIFRRNHATSVADFTGAEDQFTDFVHKTSVAAGYFDYRFTTGRFNARAGLRYEYSRLSAEFLDGSHEPFGSSLNDWVPNASVMYTLNDANTLKISYSTRINRPGINYLDPTVIDNPYSFSYGNPDLSSVKHNNVALNYSLIKQKFSLDISPSYRFANNTISQVITTDASDFSFITYENAGKLRDFTLSAFAQWTITPKTSIMTNLSAGYTDQRIDAMHLKNHHWSVNLFARATQQLPWKLRLEGMVFFNTGGLNSVYSFTDNNAKSLFHAISLQRSFLKDNRLTVKLIARNPFLKNTEWRQRYNIGEYTGLTSTSSSSRVFGFEISFRFGSVKAAVKRTATTISNDDLQGGNSAPATSSALD